MVAVAEGASDLSKEWDFCVKHISRINADQRDRDLGPGRKNSDFGFLFEQPSTSRVRLHNHIWFMQLPIQNGGDGAQRTTVDICQLGGPSQKPTDLWVSQLPAVYEQLCTADGSQKYKCPGLSPFHQHVSLRTAKRGLGPGQRSSDPYRGARFHPLLAGLLALGINQSLRGRS